MAAHKNIHIAFIVLLTVSLVHIVLYQNMMDYVLEPSLNQNLEIF